MNIGKWFMRVLQVLAVRWEGKGNRGGGAVLIVLKPEDLKKNKGLVKYNIIICADTMDELYKNFKMFEQDIYMKKNLKGQEVIN